jgi:predicted nucleic acid-binding protein
VNVVDSSAWIAFFCGERNAGAFREPVNDREKLLVPSITITEVFKFLARHLNEETALSAASHMSQGNVIALDGGLAVDAAIWSLELKLPLADSIIYATARKFGAVIWTQDTDFKDLPGVKFFP